MKEPELHYATDRRCYNGAFCDDLQREVNSKINVLRIIQAKHPEYSCTYFPMEGKYLSFLKYQELSGNMFEDKGQCLLEAWNILIKENYHGSNQKTKESQTGPENLRPH
jgi:hypothetical protein